MGNAGVESSALITYYREGAKTQMRQTLDTVAIPLAKPGFSAELTADQTTVTVGDKVTLSLTLTNEGNIDYTSVKVTDSKLGDVFTGLKLSAGEVLVETKEIIMSVPTTFRFNISLTDNTGVTQTQTTNELKISAYAEGQMMRLNAQASADRETVSELPGLVRMSVHITNDSNTTAKPVTVYHGDLRIANIGELAPGASTTVTREFSISQAGKFRFTVRTDDALNNTVSFDTNEIIIGFEAPTPAPTREVLATVAPVVTYSPIPSAGDDSMLAKGKNALFIATWGIGLLLAGSLALFLISSLMRAKARRQSDNAYDHLELQQKRDYADPNTYQGEERADQAAQADADTAELGASVSRRVREEELPHHKYLNEDAPKAEPAKAEESVSDASEAPSARDTAQDADDSADEADVSEEGAYQMVREPGEDAPAAVAAQRKPRRRAAKNRQITEDDE